MACKVCRETLRQGARWLVRLACCLSFVTSLAACQRMYYNFWEVLGKEKRDLLKERIDSTQKSQQELQEQFKDTLERIRSQYKLNGGELEKVYDKISADYDRAAAKANELKGNMKHLAGIGHDLFAEWQEEADSMQNRKLRRDSLHKLAAAKQRFSTLLTSLEAVEKKLDDVLLKMRDHKLYLKHNLNVKALDALKGEFLTIDREIQKLMGDIGNSIREAERFSQTLL